MSFVNTGATLGICYAAISPNAQLFAALPLLLVIGVLYAIVVGHYLRKKDARHSRKRRHDGDPGSKNMS